MSNEITGALFKQMVLHGAAAITAQKQAINDLNVFPVPDGDTGTNMSMTIATAAEALRKSSPASVGQASSVTASALLQGARGNSGVILSLLFRGLSKSLKGMAYRSMADGLVHLLRREAMSKGVNVIYNEDESISIELHIIVENGVNIPAVCRSIMNEVRYVVNKNTGAEVRAVDVFVDSMIL